MITIKLIIKEDAQGSVVNGVAANCVTVDASSKIESPTPREIQMSRTLNLAFCEAVAKVSATALQATIVVKNRLYGAN